MDAGTVVAIVSAALAGLAIVITLIVLLVRGGFLLGRISKQVEGLGGQIEALTTTVADLRAEVQQSNQTLAALANQTHDVDGRTVFQVPPAVSR